MLGLTIVVPIYNESRTIENLVRQLNNLRYRTNFKCVFINDGSTDQSLSLLQCSLRQVSFEYLVISQRNSGKAGAIHAAIEYVQTSHTVILDSDLEIDPGAIQVAWDTVLRGNFEAVLGFRVFRTHSSFTYRYSRGNQVISNFYGILFNSLVTDVMCGFKLVPSATLKSLPFSLPGFAFEIEILGALWMKRIRTYELQIDYYPRTRAEGKSITVLDGFKVIFWMLWLRMRIRRENGIIN